MDSDSDIEIIHATNQLNTSPKLKPRVIPTTQDLLPSLSPILIPEYSQTIKNPLQSSSLSPIPKRNILKRPAEKKLKSPSLSPIPTSSGLRPLVNTAFKLPSLCPIIGASSSKRPAHHDNHSHSPPHPSKDQITNKKRVHGSIDSGDHLASDDSSSLSSPTSPTNSSDNKINHVPNLTATSRPQELAGIGNSASTSDPASETHHTRVEASGKYPTRHLETEHVIDLATSPLSTSGIASNLANSHILKSTQTNPQTIPSSPEHSSKSFDGGGGNELSLLEISSKQYNHNSVLKSGEKLPVELDSGDSLSDLDSIFGISKPPSQSKRLFTDKGAQVKRPDSSNVSLSSFPAQNQRSKQFRTVQCNASLVTESYSQSHCLKSAVEHVDGVGNRLPRSRSAPQNPNEPLVAQLSREGKGKQATPTQVNQGGVNDDGNYFTHAEKDHDNQSAVQISTRPSLVESDPPNHPVSKNNAASSRLEKQAKATETRLAREAKKMAKEQEKLQNRMNREANKLTLNRKETVSEVRMWIPKSLKQSKLHPLTKACEVLADRISNTEDCRMHQPGEIDDERSDEPEAVVRWIRTTDKEWDEAKGIFIPLSLGKTKDTIEPTVLIVWTGKEIDEIIASGPNQLLQKVQAIKAHYPQDQLFIVISGLEAILKAEKRRENAKITNEARARLADQRNGIASNPKAKHQNSSGFLPKNTPHQILKEMEILKIITKAFIIRVEDKNEFANWLWEMTLEIGVRPYKARRQDLKSALRLEVTGSKGSNNEDTYIKMLSSLTRVTENEAKGIVSKFPTLKILYHSWQRGIEQNGIQWAEDMLVGCSKSNTITGVNSGRKIGKVTSKRIFDILYNVRNGDACI